MTLNKDTIISMVMIVLVIIVDILIMMFISNKIDPEEKIDDLN